MLLGRFLKVCRRAHEREGLVVLALCARGPGRRGLLLDVHLLGPVGLVGGDQGGAVALQLLSFGPRLGGVAAAGGADRAGEGGDGFPPREAVPREHLGGRAERGRLTPVVLFEGHARWNRGIGVCGHEALRLCPRHCPQLL